MDWKSLGPIIGAVAPVAGSILGGLIPFPGGSLIGEQFGKIIARQFGVAPTAEAVAGAVAGSPNEVVLAKIAAATEEAKAQIVGFTEMEKAAQESVRAGLLQTGQTMRLELDPERRHWFYTGWRPAIGWTFVIFAISFGAMLTLAAAGAALSDNARPLEILSSAWPIFLAYFGTLGLMVGVYIPSRSMEKKAMVDTSSAKSAPPQPPSPLKPPSPPAPPKPPLPLREPRT